MQWCFRGWRHFYETRSNNGLLEYIRGYDQRANLPSQLTCHQLLETYEELMDEQILIFVQNHLRKAQASIARDVQ